MFRRNLTAKILVAVGVTVAVVIAIYTYFVIRVQGAWWQERTQGQTIITATMVREYLNGVMLSQRHEEVTGFLNQLVRSDDIVRGRVIRPDGTVVFSTATQEIHRVSLHVPAELFQDDRILQGTRTENAERYAMAIAPVRNLQNCQQCHDARAPFLGAIVIEKSLAPAEASLSSNRNLLIAYGVIIFALVGAVLWLLIVRLVSQPVSTLLRRMRKVEAGDLTVRAPTTSQDEIGELAHAFNEMVSSLEEAKRELHESHAQQIQQAGKLASIGELAAGIAHEIRNPLAGIGAAVEVLADGQNGDQEIVREIRSQIKRLNTTLCDLLDFARVRDPEIEPCELRTLIRPMFALIRADARKHHVELIEDFPAELPPILADAKQAQQAMLNVLLNGIQAMPNGGTLTVRALLAGSNVQLTISDTGAGITPETLGKIFSPFFTTKHRGTGLGLAITRSIMEKHGGTIIVASQPGQGSTFTLTFPAAPVPQEITYAKN
mgnify:CR=1 FL=1